MDFLRREKASGLIELLIAVLLLGAMYCLYTRNHRPAAPLEKINGTVLPHAGMSTTEYFSVLDNAKEKIKAVEKKQQDRSDGMLKAAGDMSAGH